MAMRHVKGLSFLFQIHACIKSMICNQPARRLSGLCRHRFERRGVSLVFVLSCDVNDDELFLVRFESSLT